MIRVNIRRAVFTFFFLLAAVQSARADQDSKPGGNGFSSNIRGLLFVNAQYPSQNSQNPNNAFLQLERYSSNAELRPDFYYDRSSVSAVFKPRLIYSHQWWEDGAMKGETDSLSKAFVNEWYAQGKLHETLLLSFGKQKLLWGPSFLNSPSNLFFKDTEKINPKAEVEGKYLARAVWLPTKAATVSLIAETQQDENERGETVKPMQALKADILGTDFLISLIGYHGRDDRFRLGSYGQWTASDAILLYYDGFISKGTDVLYPLREPGHPVGGEFVPKYSNSARLFATMTACGSYTFLSGSTFSMEFLYNEAGYNDAEASDYYALRENAAAHLFVGGMISGLSMINLADAFGTGSSSLRRYYVMAQFMSREIRSVVDLALRYTYGVEEHAGQVSTILEWQLSDRMQLFNINTVSPDSGGNNEFNSLFTKSFMAGIEYHF
jgi:hypothetical protein